MGQRSHNKVAEKDLLVTSNHQLPHTNRLTYFIKLLHEIEINKTQIWGLIIRKDIKTCQRSKIVSVYRWQVRSKLKEQIFLFLGNLIILLLVNMFWNIKKNDLKPPSLVSTLILKSNKYRPGKNYKQILLMNTDAKILNKILVGKDLHILIKYGNQLCIFTLSFPF